MDNKKKRDFFKIQNKYRQRTRRKSDTNNEYEVVIIALIFLAIIIVKWLD